MQGHSRTQCKVNKNTELQRCLEILLFEKGHRALEPVGTACGGCTNSFKSTLQKIRETGMGFYGSPLNLTSLTCELTAAEATQGKEQGKEPVVLSGCVGDGWMEAAVERGSCALKRSHEATVQTRPGPVEALDGQGAVEVASQPCTHNARMNAVRTHACTYTHPHVHLLLIYSISEHLHSCLLYTSPSPRDRTRSRMPSSA